MITVVIPMDLVSHAVHLFYLLYNVYTHLNYKDIMKQYTLTQIAYLAGIIDGEGSIYIGNFSSNPKTGSLYYQTNMEVTNTDKLLIDWLVENIGGRSTIYTAKQTPQNSRKEVYRWIVSGNLLTHLCHLLLPYLIIKKRQCEIMIEMRKTFEKTGMQKGFQGIQPIDQETLILRKKYFDEMRSLHCRNYSNKL